MKKEDLLLPGAQRTIELSAILYPGLMLKSCLELLRYLNVIQKLQDVYQIGIN